MALCHRAAGNLRYFARTLWQFRNKAISRERHCGAARRILHHKALTPISLRD